ncbi:4667_t:CDS:2, partial [Funneliformis geosporum]
GGKPDRQQAKEWDEERHKRRSTSVHFHNPSFGIMTINGGAGTIEGGTFAGLSISKKRNQGDGQKDLEQASPYVMLSYMAMQRPFLIIDSFFFKNSRKRNKLISNDQINEDQGQSSSNDDESDLVGSVEKKFVLTLLTDQADLEDICVSELILVSKEIFSSRSY